MPKGNSEPKKLDINSHFLGANSCVFYIASNMLPAVTSFRFASHSQGPNGKLIRGGVLRLERPPHTHTQHTCLRTSKPGEALSSRTELPQKFLFACSNVYSLQILVSGAPLSTYHQSILPWTVEWGAGKFLLKRINSTPRSTPNSQLWLAFASPLKPQRFFSHLEGEWGGRIQLQHLPTLLKEDCEKEFSTQDTMTDPRPPFR